MSSRGHRRTSFAHGTRRYTPRVGGWSCSAPCRPCGGSKTTTPGVGRHDLEPSATGPSPTHRFATHGWDSRAARVGAVRRSGFGGDWGHREGWTTWLQQRRFVLGAVTVPPCPDPANERRSSTPAGVAIVSFGSVVPGRTHSTGRGLRRLVVFRCRGEVAFSRVRLDPDSRHPARAGHGWRIVAHGTARDYGGILSPLPLAWLGMLGVCCSRARGLVDRGGCGREGYPRVPFPCLDLLRRETSTRRSAGPAANPGLRRPTAAQGHRVT